MNVEVCAGTRAVKYLAGYLTKGTDFGQIEIGRNEISEYVNGSYICSHEAYMKLMSHKLHDSSHAVINLKVHLEG